MGFTDSIKANSAANKAYRLHAMGNQLLNTGKNSDAKKKHDEALEAYAQSYDLGCRKPQYMIGYAILLMRKGEFQRARDIMLDVNANPKLTKDEKYQLRINYSVCQWKLGHLDTAIETIRRAEKSGHTSMIYTTLGIFLIDKAIQTGDFSEAIAYNAEAMEYDDEDASTLDNMGQMYLAMSNKDLENGKSDSAAENRAKALDYFQKAHERKETQVTTLYALALLLHENGQNDEARRYICKAEENLLSAVCPVSKEQILQLKAEIG